MKTYLINLDRSCSRLEKMRRRFDKIGVEFTRISAIDGQTVSEQEIDAFLKLRRPRRWRYGEIGCFLSHLKSWQMLVESGEECAAIFEDDTHLSFELSLLLSNSAWIAGDADIVRLETTFRKTEISCDHTKVSNEIGLHRLRSLDHGTGAYVITANAAKRLLENQADLKSTIDSSLFDFQEASCRGLKIYQLNPAPVVQEIIFERHIISAAEMQTEIEQTEMVPGSKPLSQHQKIKRELLRPAKQLKNGIIRKVNGLRGNSMWMKINYYGNALDGHDQLHSVAGHNLRRAYSSSM